MQSKYFQKGMDDCHKLFILYGLKRLNENRIILEHPKYQQMSKDNISAKNILLYTQGFSSELKELNEIGIN